MPAYYADTVGNFWLEPLDRLELRLTRAYESDRYKDLLTTRLTAWRNQIQDLKDALGADDLPRFHSDNWGIAIEFVVPRKMGRIAAVLLIGNAIVVLEFKGESVDSSAANQVEIIVWTFFTFTKGATAGSSTQWWWARQERILGYGIRGRYGELRPTVFLDTKAQGSWLASVVQEHCGDSQLSILHSNGASYRPVPTIVEAAIGMFAEMEVDDIAKAGCDPSNLTATAETIRPEFQIQGLELDWICVCWGGDFLRAASDWNLKRLRGATWQKIHQESARAYLVNSYRVLLTRARQGMLLFVPLGDEQDSTRPRAPFDETAQFLTECGARAL